MTPKGECGSFGATHHGYRECLLSRGPVALILEGGRSSLSPNKDLSKTSTSTSALSPLRLFFPRLQKIMFFMTLWYPPCNIRTISKSCTTQALASMIHNWHVSSDGNSAVIRVVLYDFRKAFDLIDHNILVRKLSDYDILSHILCWIVDFFIG